MVDIMERWNTLVGAGQLVNEWLTPVDLRGGKKYVSSTPGIMSPASVGMAGGVTGYRTIGQVMQGGAGTQLSRFGQIASTTAKTGGLKNELMRYGAVGAVMGGIATGFYALSSYLGGAASTLGSYTEQLKPRPEFQGRSFQQESSLQMGSGLMAGYGQQFIPNIQASAAEQARLYQEYSPQYIEAAVNKIWAEQQARYESNLAYPTFPVQDTQKIDPKMPYTPKIV